MKLVTDNRIEKMTDRGCWGRQTLEDLFRKALAAGPDSPAVVDPPNREDFIEGEPRRLTYKELDELADLFAARMIDLGVRPDDVIVCQLANVVELAALYLAAARSRVMVSPVPIQFRGREIQDVFAQVDPALFVGVPQIGEFRPFETVADMGHPADRTAVIGTQGPDGVEALGAPTSTPAPSPEVDANDVLTICWTSGTEGRPKGVPRSHNEWIVPAWATVDSARLSNGDVVLNPFPMINMAGIGGMFVPWLLTGGTLVMHQPFDLGVLLGQIAKEKVAYTVAPPALLTLLLKKDDLLSQADLSTVRTIGSGSAPLSPWMVTEWQQGHGIEIINYFGSNEGATFVSGPDTIPDTTARAMYFPRFGVEGISFPDRVARCMESRLVDPDNQEEVSVPGVVGEMRIKGAQVFSGYYRRPELSEEAFDDEGFYRTGDLFELAADDEGEIRFYRFVGRAGDVINRGGMKIVPEELETLLAGHPDVVEAAVVGYPDDVMGEKNAVFAVLRPDAELTLEDVRDHLAEQELATFKLPDWLEVVEALPRNAVGKVLKDELRDSLS